MYSIVQPRTICMGRGSLQYLEEIIRQMGPKRILIVTGPHVQGLGIVDRALQAMGSYKTQVEVFINPKPEPEVAVVEKCAERVRERGYDLIVGIGGGSPMDVAKGTAVVAVHGGGMRPLLGRNQLKRRGIPAILIPTTAGSGTEVTQAVVVKVPEEGTKKSIWDPRAMAEAAIIDPELTADIPPRLTAETGVDALVHAVEGYTARGANPMSRMYAAESLRLIGKYLVKAYQDGSNMEAREAMARAATLAGIGCTNGGLGAIHALALALDSREGFNHCQSLAVLAPWVVRFNLVGNERLYAGISEAFGESQQGISVKESALKAFEAILRIFHEIGISSCLKDYGIRGDEIKPLALKAYRLGQRLLLMNVRDFSEEDAIRIFQEAHRG